MPRRDRPVPPLDAATLERLALRYVERFATTRGKLAQYLARKVRERGWEGEPPDVAALASQMAELGYVDDRLFAQNKAAVMTRKGLGARRVAGALRAARVDEEDIAAVSPDLAEQAWTSAITFARKRKLGPFGAPVADRAAREKQLAAMLRAGHAIDLARRIVDAEEEPEAP